MNVENNPKIQIEHQYLVKLFTSVGFQTLVSDVRLLCEHLHLISDNPVCFQTLNESIS